ncbi:MAG TPA: protein kinase [Thermoanaerobaculia bacterium]|jgi:tetratricopeptide (TPR) repeat protein|nr:protein kinase [Thermoanaerobaculia bacterium]
MTKTLFSNLFGDPRSRAETAEKEGRKAEALRLYAKGGDHRQAAKLAVDLRNVPAAVEHTLRTLFGRIPEGYEGLDAAQAAELLAKSGKLKDALTLFDLAEAWPQAAEVALKLQQPSRAALYFERGKSYDQAALFYQRAGQPTDALRVYELEAVRLREILRRGPDPAAQAVLEKVERQRAELLTRAGRTDGKGGDPPRDAGSPSPGSPRQLESDGDVRAAIEAFLASGNKDQALRLLEGRRGLDRRFKAEAFRRLGRLVEAAQLYVSLGSMREAADLFEQGRDWARAATAWETARDPLRAAEAFERAERFSDAGRCYLAAAKPEAAARLYLRGGDLLGAGAALEQAGRRLDAANIYQKANDLSRAARVLRSVMPEEPEYLAATHLLAPILLKQRAFDEALARLQTPAASGPPGHSSAETFYWQGRVLEALGSDSEALARYRLAVALKPDHAEAALRVRTLAEKAPARPPVTFTPGEWPAGHRLANRYEILGTLGKGGMGCVYRARDTALGEVVAIKTVMRGQGESSNEHEERLLREIQICRKIDHPNVVRVFDFGRFPGGLFLTMELIEGQGLDVLMREIDPPPLEQVRRILSEVASGLGAAHALQIIHRDLKPTNVILNDKRLKILDFGVAKIGDDVRLTQTGFAVGSPLYMSPEQLQGLPIDGRSDLYAVGILAFALLAGYEPFHGETFTTIAMGHLQSPVPDLHRIRPALPRPWINLVEKLLEKRAEDRPRNAAAVIDLLATMPV